ncbi:hypothetical protein FA15DRAFT_631596 [Coprinopsis marcescibilis]|uniref:Cytochrome c oxidase assembly protein n=1 Tax=Coprinopsis marcescibilis TaxID=230819 RepID=A0A5C3LA92_COPMA|nr:hypothetical protein FA15DRAFT_631596 [Coprinopsis marcescibilis]
MASRSAKMTLAGATAFCALTIWGVHYQQHQERETMYQGVLRDDERRKEKMKQRQIDMEESQRKRELYEQHQRVQK